jgi:hypothetical protein
MLRWLGFMGVVVVALTVVGCTGTSELPPSEEATQVDVDPKAAMQKAMQGMPEDVLKKMQSQMKSPPQ